MESTNEKKGSVVDVEQRSIDMEHGIKPSLHERHLQMIAIAGMIGTGLFLGSGSAIARAGPVGALLSYVVMGLVTAAVSYTSGEMSAFMPVTGGFTRHAARMVEPACGAATGWNFWYSMAITAPAEITAASGLIEFWDSSVSPAVWISIFLVFILVVNFCGVRLYGESEVVFATLKIMLIVGIIIAGLVVDLGGGPDHDRRGFRNWQHPGPFNEYLTDGNTGKFLAWWSTLISAAFSYGAIQVVAIAGAETNDPRRTIPKATKRTFTRVILFYVLSIFIAGLIIRSDDVRLQVSTGTASQSPFVIAFQESGIKALPSIINAIVITSALSSGSACVYLASRTLFGLSREGHAPKFFQHCNRFGVPVYAVGATAIFLPLAYLVLGSSASVVFGWFVNITTVSGLIGWAVLEISFLRMYYAFKAQGHSRDELPYKSPLQPYTAWFALVFVILVILFSGFSVFFPGHFTASGFLTAYVNIPIFIVLYLGFKIMLKLKIYSTTEIDIETELEIIAREAHRYDEEPKSLPRRVLDKIF
ncbi:amino acid permease [Grosmannia clavigera kw1407]|uniref:Amino acid permease n=1 Tax=Grosmannia clavigera (strain kw1407 / UAMH 11150) TaxID=655863 RepID=F0X9Q8_GROCL|nr:amino acid permease [Grosmannia clavigera kw1407]EFX05535.1 amino acid permease [Grosmannia clavigera kw1407]